MTKTKTLSARGAANLCPFCHCDHQVLGRHAVKCARCGAERIDTWNMSDRADWQITVPVEAIQAMIGGAIRVQATRGVAVYLAPEQGLTQ